MRAASVEQQDEHFPADFGPFRLMRRLTRGGMGELYYARTSWPDAPVAVLKRLRPDATEEMFVRRFEHEADLAVRLDHPNLVRALQVGSVGTALYVASEPVIGQNAAEIRRRFRQRGMFLPMPLVLSVMYDVLSAMIYLHHSQESLQIIHRDISLSNILIGYDGTAKLLDFGIAKSALTRELNLTQGCIVGTPAFLAPEIVLGAAPTRQTDIYGLGAVAYSLLTNRTPFEGDVSGLLFRVVSERPIPIRELRPDVPQWLEALVHGMMAADPDARPRSAREILDGLDEQSSDRDACERRKQTSRVIREMFAYEHREEIQLLRAIAKTPPPVPTDSLLDCPTVVPLDEVETDIDAVFDEEEDELEAIAAPTVITCDLLGPQSAPEPAKPPVAWIVRIIALTAAISGIGGALLATWLRP